MFMTKLMKKNLGFVTGEGGFTFAIHADFPVQTQRRFQRDEGTFLLMESEKFFVEFHGFLVQKSHFHFESGVFQNLHAFSVRFFGRVECGDHHFRDSAF
ncbi:hypothetical protein A2974_01785 [Candidatus Peregrinibacteria bacterium RIFCSPLOWO2_01_FULL_48_20]|nr:MAG: hypothetical protein A2974_01785 [Candidatus Peregrinibacteria bacterium RIFCSPLOWO2_01_FULL_48_20]